MLIGKGSGLCAYGFGRVREKLPIMCSAVLGLKSYFGFTLSRALSFFIQQ